MFFIAIMPMERIMRTFSEDAIGCLIRESLDTFRVIHSVSEMIAWFAVDWALEPRIPLKHSSWNVYGCSCFDFANVNPCFIREDSSNAWEFVVLESTRESCPDELKIIDLPIFLMAARNENIGTIFKLF